MVATTKPPVGFWIAAVLLLVWGLVGVAGFHLDLASTPAQRAAMPAHDRKLMEARPAWQMAVYGVAVWTGLLGTVALLARRRAALALYLVSLVAVIVMFAWTFAATDLWAVKGAGAAVLPVFIAAIGLIEIWLARHALQRGWIG